MNIEHFISTSFRLYNTVKRIINDLHDESSIASNLRGFLESFLNEFMKNEGTDKIF